MTSRGSSGRLLFFLVLASFVLAGASPALNPRVTKSANVHGLVPDDCNQSLALASMPRVDVAQIPPAQYVALDLTPPPSGDLRMTLRDAQEALRRNDRATFDANLVRAKSLLQTYPAGAERRAAEELVRIYDDASTVWDAQFSAPFFDQSSNVYARLSAYPGWSDAVRRGVLMDDRDHRFYPAAESRTFLTSIAADRLGRLGVRTAPVPTTRVAAARDTTVSRKRTTLHPRTETKAKTPVPTTKKTTSSRTASTRKSAPVSPDPPARRTPRVAATPAPVAKTVPTSPVSPPVAGGSSTTTVATATVATATTASAPAPVVATSPAPTTDTGSSTTDTVASATDTVATDSVFTADTALATDTAVASDTATTATQPAPASNERTRSVILPTILILIGLGVLIVLFRASK